MRGSVPSLLCLTRRSKGPTVELRNALNVRATNKARVEHARTAITLDGSSVTNLLASFSGDIESLDNSVLRLVESTNAIRNGEYIEYAIAVSKEARDVQSTFALLRNLYIDAFRLRREILEEVIENDGSLYHGRPMALASNHIRRLMQNSPKISGIAHQQKTAEQHIETAMGRLKDAFRADARISAHW